MSRLSRRRSQCKLLSPKWIDAVARADNRTMLRRAPQAYVQTSGELERGACSHAANSGGEVEVGAEVRVGAAVLGIAGHQKRSVEAAVW